MPAATSSHPADAAGAGGAAEPAALRFLTPELVHRVRAAHGSPTYVYDAAALRAAAAAALRFPHAYGLTVRYAMKAAPNAAILRILTAAGLHIDASSTHEAHRALAAGVAPPRISVSAQELGDDFVDLVRRGVLINACSLAQLRRYAAAFPGGAVGVRFNPGLGSGGSAQTNVGGPAASFGVWHELLPAARAAAAAAGVRIVRVHTHIGSGSDPAVWQRAAALSLRLAAALPDAAVVNLGGGYKVARVAGETAADLAAVGVPVRAAFEAFAAEHGRRLRLEIEPGTYIAANAGSLLCTVQDIVSTRGAGPGGYDFIKLDAGMTEILRPALYGSQHPVVVVPPPGDPRGAPGAPTQEYVVVGHCCESGDLLTPADGAPGELAPRRLRAAAAGDALVVDGAGAYCSSMAAAGYNSFPAAAEVLVDTAAAPVPVRLIRRRATLAQLLENEVAPDEPRARL